MLVEPMQGSGGCVVATPSSSMRCASGATRDRSGPDLRRGDDVAARAGGAQARFGVTPDMTTLGKYLAGGMTFGAFGGSRSIMSAFDPATGGALTQAGTFNNNVVDDGRRGGDACATC